MITHGSWRDRSKYLKTTAMIQNIGTGIGLISQRSLWMVKGINLNISFGVWLILDSVVRRQMFLIENYKPQPGEKADAETIAQRAYDQARKEFYQLRLDQDVEREVAKEEAQHLGTHEEELFIYNNIGQSQIERNLKLEDDALEDWRNWAIKDIQDQKNKAASMFAGSMEEEATDNVEAADFTADVVAEMAKTSENDRKQDRRKKNL